MAFDVILAGEAGLAATIMNLNPVKNDRVAEQLDSDERNQIPITDSLDTIRARFPGSSWSGFQPSQK